MSKYYSVRTYYAKMLSAEYSAPFLFSLYGEDVNHCGACNQRWAHCNCDNLSWNVQEMTPTIRLHRLQEEEGEGE